jgi:lipoteichoic acid synthase
MPGLSRILERIPFLKRLIQPSQRYVSLNFAFFIVLILLRCYEYLAVGDAHALPENSFQLFLLSLWYDFVLLLLMAGLLAIPFLALSLLKPRAGVIFYGTITLLCAIIDVALLQYFAVTFTPLGSDLFGYSWRDIQLTVSSSGGFSLWTVLPFAATIALAIGATLLSARIRPPGIVTGFSFVLIFLSLVFVGDLTPDPKNFKLESEYNLASNKLGFFVSKVLLFSADSQSDEGEIPTREYPLLHDVTYNDVLGPYFTSGSRRPNLVFIIVEGLGRSFVGEGAPLGGFTPFLDSLIGQSLYWENFLSTSGRTFAVLPSLFGSLPYGENGFMEMGYRMPSHLSLIRLLKEQGYFTSYYYGGNANFDLQDVFLERQQLDFLVDEYQFGPGYGRSEANVEGFSWGYADRDLFKRSLEVINDKKKDPRLDIYLTISTHEPFLPPNKEHYLREFDERFGRLNVDPQRHETYKKYRQEFSSLLYADDALRFLMTEYQQRPEYDHTIFFITGDHRIIPIPAEAKIDRYHVPFIIFSKMLKYPKRFSSISTHADVTPSILAFLQANYGVSAPWKAHWLGTGIDTAVGFRNIHTMPLMRNKGELTDYLDKDYFLTGDQLFKLRAGLVPEVVQDKDVQSRLERNFGDFKRINRYVSRNNKLYPQSADRSRFATTAEGDSAFAALDSLKLNSNQLFQLAQEKAAANKYEEARTVCRKLLRNGPNFHDVRTLLGRTYAWEKRYDEARAAFDEVIRRAPNYPDAQIALVDVEFWSGNNNRVLGLVNQALLRFPSNQEFHVRKVKVLAAMGRRDEALLGLNQLLKLNPLSADALALRKQLGK